jgi:hypothetical protein
MRARTLIAAAAAFGFTFSPPGAAPSVTAPEFPPASFAANCTIADAELWATRPIDTSSCDADGTGDAAHRAQNLAKNNLCAGGFLTSDPEPPALATQLTFRKLQEAAEEIRDEHDLGPQTVPEDRTLFAGDVHTTTEGEALGEGALVRYVGFLLEGHFSGEEGVNCGRTRQENYDIHLAFSNTKPPLSPTKAQGEALECRSITAEIIPRRRPDEWSLLGLMKKTSAQGIRAAQAKIDAHSLRRPLRITGQLFFDGSHQACSDGARVGGNPARASNWEIHPVYAIDVCEFVSASSCAWNNEAVWTPLHKWLEDE